MLIKVEPWSKPVKLTENYGSKCVLCGKPMVKAEKAVDGSYLSKEHKINFRTFVKVHARCVGMK